MRKSKLTDAEIAGMFSTTRINDIAVLAGISRQAVRDSLIRSGVYNPRHGSVEKVCPFCRERFTAWRNVVRRGGGNYCSVQCFHADRSIGGEYSAIGGAMTRLTSEIYGVQEATTRNLSREARRAVKQAGIVLKPGQVVHHIDGDRSNNKLENLMIFDSHTAHMQYHHSLRKSGPKRKASAGKRVKSVPRPR